MLQVHHLIQNEAKKLKASKDSGKKRCTVEVFNKYLFLNLILVNPRFSSHNNIPIYVFDSRKKRIIFMKHWK